MKIVGVTACPTGIAHTYMSAEKLTITAEALGYEVKIETQGAKVENVLTKEDIATADYVILAVDKEIDTSRFAGKKIKKVSTSRAIKEADVVIEETISGKGLISLEAKSSDISSEQPSKASLYNHFMNGVNYMLPFVIAGGILIAISFAFGIDASNLTLIRITHLQLHFQKLVGILHLV